MNDEERNRLDLALRLYRRNPQDPLLIRQTPEVVETEPPPRTTLPALPGEAGILLDKRCTSQQRRETADFLADMYAEGCLDDEEFAARNNFASTAKTSKELARVIADLPYTVVEWHHRKRTAANLEKAERDAADQRERERLQPPPRPVPRQGKKAAFVIAIFSAGVTGILAALTAVQTLGDPPSSVAVIIPLVMLGAALFLLLLYLLALTRKEKR